MHKAADGKICSQDRKKLDAPLFFEPELEPDPEPEPEPELTRESAFVASGPMDVLFTLFAGRSRYQTPISVSPPPLFSIATLGPRKVFEYSARNDPK